MNIKRYTLYLECAFALSILWALIWLIARFVSPYSIATSDTDRFIWWIYEKLKLAPFLIYLVVAAGLAPGWVGFPRLGYRKDSDISQETAKVLSWGWHLLLFVFVGIFVQYFWMSGKPLLSYGSTGLSVNYTAQYDPLAPLTCKLPLLLGITTLSASTLLVMQVSARHIRVGDPSSYTAAAIALTEGVGFLLLSATFDHSFWWSFIAVLQVLPLVSMPLRYIQFQTTSTFRHSIIEFRLVKGTIIFPIQHAGRTNG